jgi:hypothetical protein
VFLVSLLSHVIYFVGVVNNALYVVDSSMLLNVIDGKCLCG